MKKLKHPEKVCALLDHLALDSPSARRLQYILYTNNLNGTLDSYDSEYVNCN